ncbi:MAG TPA: DUF3857 and transglutaminase domain-containing protein [Acidisarcina sp.]
MRHAIKSLTLLFAAAVSSAWGGSSSFPDWVVQAAITKTPVYPPATRAVVLLDDRLLSIGEDGRAIERHREVIKILRPQGREFAEIAVSFSKDEKLNSFHCWSIGPDGHQFTVKDDQVREYGADASGMLYIDERFKVVHPPGSDPGGVVAYESEQQLPTYLDEEDWDFQRSIPVARAVFEVDMPPSWHHYEAWLRRDAPAAVEIAPNHERWELENIAGIDLEDEWMAPSVRSLAARMVVHFSALPLPEGEQRWTQIGNWYDKLASSRTDGPMEIASKARGLAGEAPDFTARIQKVAEFMQREIRYVGIEIGIGGLQPHAAIDVFHNRYGDCKDKATLLISMLNAVGVRATWVLVDTHRGFVDPSLPSMQGNHAIAAIEMPVGYNDPRLQAVVKARSGKRFLIFDPTSTYTPIGLLPEYLQGGYGILVDGNSSQVIELPTLKPSQDVVERTATFNLDEDGTLKGDVTESRFGTASRYLRTVYNELGEKKQHEEIERLLRQDFSSFTLDSEAAKNARDLDKNLVLTYALTAKMYAKPAGSLLLVRPRVLGTDSAPFNNKPRVYPIDMEATGTWRDTYDVNLPAGYVVDDLPNPVNIDVGFATYRSEVKADDKALHYTREYVVKELELPAIRYAELRRLEGTIRADEESSAVLKKK